MNGPSLSRRSYLLGTGAMAGLAGCGGLSNVLSGETPAGPIEPPDKDDPLKQRFEVKEREQFFRDTDDGSLNAKASLPDTESLAPVLVHVHGGAYREGGPGFPAMDTFAGAGIGVVSIEYRLGEQADYPNLVRDVGAGVRWVKTNEPEWTLDTDRVAMIGNSAGAHLSALVAAAPDHSNLHPEEYDS